MALIHINYSIISGKWGRDNADYLCSTVRQVSLFRGICGPECRRLLGRLGARKDQGAFKVSSAYCMNKQKAVGKT